jgi:hypothetical protein
MIIIIVASVSGAIGLALGALGATFYWKVLPTIKK